VFSRGRGGRPENVTYFAGGSYLFTVSFRAGPSSRFEIRKPKKGTVNDIWVRAKRYTSVRSSAGRFSRVSNTRNSPGTADFHCSANIASVGQF